MAYTAEDLRKLYLPLAQFVKVNQEQNQTIDTVNPKKRGTIGGKTTVFGEIINEHVNFYDAISVVLTALGSTAATSFKDSVFEVTDASDVTKRLQVNVDNSTGIITTIKTTSSSNQTVTIPNVGTSDFVMTAGGQTIQGQKRFTDDGTVADPTIIIGSKMDGFYKSTFNSQDTIGASINDTHVGGFDSKGFYADSLRSKTIGFTAGVAQVTSLTYGDGRDFTTELVLSNFNVGTLNGTTADYQKGALLGNLPAGASLVGTSYAFIGLNAAGAANTPLIAIGTTLANAASASLSGTTNDISVTPIVLTNITGTQTEGSGSPQLVLATTDTKDLYLNIASSWDSTNTGAATVSGKITLKWTLLNKL